MKQNQKPCITMNKVIDRGKRSKTLSKVTPVKNISKDLQSFLEIKTLSKVTPVKNISKDLQSFLEISPVQNPLTEK